ncbi:MAG: DUF3488 domain-containing protein [Nocardioidaceae bacterium]
MTSSSTSSSRPRKPSTVCATTSARGSRWHRSSPHQRRRAPVSRLLVLFGIGVVAVLVDFFAAGVRRVPLTGLPLLILYTVPVTALPDGVPIYGFLPGAAAYIALLLADERDRLSHWGRLVSRTPDDSVQPTMDTSGLVSNGRRIAVIAVTSAVVLPVFIPAFSSAWFDNGRGVGNGPGNGTNLSFSDPMVSLAQSLRRPVKEDVLVVSGPTSPEYLRLVVLDQPGPDNWSASALDLDNTLPLDRTLPAPEGVGDDVESNRQPARHRADRRVSHRLLIAAGAVRTAQRLDRRRLGLRPPGPDGLGHQPDVGRQHPGVLRELLPAGASRRSSCELPVHHRHEIQQDFGQVPDDVPAVVQNLARQRSPPARRTRTNKRFSCRRSSVTPTSSPTTSTRPTVMATTRWRSSCRSAAASVSSSPPRWR